MASAAKCDLRAPVIEDDAEDEELASLSASKHDNVSTRIKDRTDNKRARKTRICALLIVALILTTCACLAVFRHQFFHSDSAAAFSQRTPTHPAYTVLQSDHISEYNSRLVLYQHRATRAEFLAYLPSSSREDKVFGASFRTLPATSSGVAHVIEHSVLNGSRKYPVKDPFLYLLKGTLNTFLNAMTYNDRTVYPVASRNRADFLNLVGVYLDAVFYPNAIYDPNSQWILQQEGWHYHVQTDNNDTLEIKGVVYSEMKGVYSDPESILERVSESLLFPDNTYNYDSGGDPKVIPTLTQQDFAAFYNEFYRVENAKLFVSGNTDDVQHVMDMTDTYLVEKQTDLTTTIKQVQYQKKTFQVPLRKRRAYAVEDINSTTGQNMVCITWLLNDASLSPMSELALLVLDHLLLGTPSAVLNKELLNSGYGASVIGGGISNELLQSSFAVGMKGVTGESSVPGVESVIMEVLETVGRDGFDMDDIEAAINSVEFKLRELSTGSDPTGVTIFLSILTKWNYDQDPKSALVFEDALALLKANVKDNGSTVFQDLINQLFLANTHRVILELYPSDTLEQQELQDENKRLTDFKNSLTPEQYQAIVQQSQALIERQNLEDSPQALATIPTLGLADLDQQGEEYPINVQKDAYNTGATIVAHQVPSSQGIVYVDFGLDISGIDYDDVDLLPLFAYMLRETGANGMSDIELDRMIGTHTGGINVEIVIQSSLPEGSTNTIVTRNSTHFQTFLFVRGKCTTDKLSEMFPLFVNIMTNANLDFNKKALQILDRTISDVKSDIPNSGHSYANKRIKARYSVEAFLQEKLYGISRLDVLEALSQQAKNDWPSLLRRLQRIRTTILSGSRNGLILNLTGDEKVLDKIKGIVQNFLEHQQLGSVETSFPDYRKLEHPWGTYAFSDMAVQSPLKDEGLVVSSLVSYVGKGGILYDLNETVPGSADVVSRYLNTGYLWETIRVKNGAYGAMSSLSASDGVYDMLSYRDPNLALTLDAYDGAGDSLLNDVASNMLNDRNQAALITAIIGAIGALDGSAKHPDQVGWTSLLQWMSGKDASHRQQWRNEILSTQQEDFATFGQKLKSWKQSSIAVVGSQAAFDRYGELANSVLLNLVTVA